MTYEELESKVWQLEKELQTALILAAKLADEKVALRMELQTKNLYAELGKLVYNNATDIDFEDVGIIYKYNEISNQIRESEESDG